jgi:hypothetical protein
MWKWIRALDQVLRGEATQPANLRLGKIDIPVGGLSLLIILLGFFYGLCMGWFAVLNRVTPEYRQLLATVLKVPALFLLTLLVTFPSLYVFNAMVGSRLTVPSLLRLLIASLAVMLAVLASFGPVVAFFSLTTTDFPFMRLLNVLVFGIAGLLGLVFLLQTLHRLTVGLEKPGPSTPADTSERPPGALERMQGHVLGSNVKAVFHCWVVIFGLVGAQMSWVLRPFIGTPDQPFVWFGPRQSNFFEAVWIALKHVLS